MKKLPAAGAGDPPPVPGWTPQLAWSGLKARLKRTLLAARAGLYRPWISPSSPPPALATCRRILVFRTDRLGDALLTFPFVLALRDLAPSAEILYAVPETWAGLFHHPGRAIRVIGLGDAPREQANLLARLRPDLILDPGTDAGSHTARLARDSGAPCRVGFSGYGRERFFTSYAPPPQNCHFSRETFQLLDLWENEPVAPPRPPFLEVPLQARNWWGRMQRIEPLLMEDYLCLHPGAHFETQRWPLDRFRELSVRIRRELNRSVVWCWDRERESVERECHGDRLRQAGVLALAQLSPEQLAAVIGGARLFIGNNSGPLHLACALGTPTLSLMGPTIPWRWWPLGDHNTVLRLEVACSPCRLGRCSHHTCLTGLDVARVFHSVRHITYETGPQRES